MRRRWLSLTCTRVVALLTIFLLLMIPDIAHASSISTHTETLSAGPYLIDASLDPYPPTTDQSVEVKIVPHGGDGMHLSGRVLMVPGLGTDAVELHASLSPLNQTDTLIGSIHIPVRGAWNIVIQLNGPHGQGQASFPITVGAPGAIPIWMGWLIALLPFLGVTWLLFNQYRYRKQLLANEAQ